MVLGQAQLPAAQDSGVPSPALAGGTFFTSSEEVASGTMPPSCWEMPLLRPAKVPRGTMATTTPSHTVPILAKSLKGSPSALTGDAGGMEGYSPSSILTRKTPVPASRAGTRHWRPLQPHLPGGYPLSVPSQHLRSSHITGPIPGKCCRLLPFLPCNNIFPAQNNIGKVIGLLLLFQARLPPLPQP